MVNHTSFMSYFFEAGLVVKLVMLILIVTSIASWTLIIQRAMFFKQKKKLYDEFSNRFWQSTDLSKLYEDLESEGADRNGLGAIFYAGFKEFVRMRNHGNILLEPMQRVMQIIYAKEAELLEQHLPIFASVGSLAPYVGLFGTVWGIMTSFQALGQAQQATIAMVAPGISEALIATALGLFTAIPAVIAYNRYSSKANGLLNRYDLFQEELVALISEQSAATSKG
jgi:biopolymer transport protein TolQ